MHIEELLVHLLRPGQEVTPRHPLDTFSFHEACECMPIGALLQSLPVCHEVNAPFPVKLCHGFLVLFEKLLERINVVDESIEVGVVEGVPSLLYLNDVE